MNLDLYMYSAGLSVACSQCSVHSSYKANLLLKIIGSILQELLFYKYNILQRAAITDEQLKGTVSREKFSKLH